VQDSQLVRAIRDRSALWAVTSPKHKKHLITISRAYAQSDVAVVCCIKLLGGAIVGVNPNTNMSPVALLFILLSMSVEYTTAAMINGENRDTVSQCCWLMAIDRLTKRERLQTIGPKHCVASALT
jgi:hypothetical protein